MGERLIKHQPVTLANVPQAKVISCAVSADAGNVIYALKDRNIQVVPVTRCTHLAKPVASHADMQLCYVGNGRAFVAQEAIALQPKLQELGITTQIIQKPLTAIYPHDILLNCLFLNQHCFGLQSNVAQEILDFCKDHSIEFVNCKQGYTRCSVAVAGDNLAITADRTLHKILMSHQIECLLIEPGGISLPGYSTGFIGGCCGLIDNNLLAFAGDLKNYVQGEKIIEFLNRHQVEYVCLHSGNLTDVGGIIPLTCANLELI